MIVVILFGYFHHEMLLGWLVIREIFQIQVII